LPHIAGITVGFAFHGRGGGLGLGTIFIALSGAADHLKYAGVAYLIYLAVGDRDVGAISAAAGQQPDR